MMDIQKVSKMRSIRKIQVMINIRENEVGCHRIRFYPKDCNCERCQELLVEISILRTRLEILSVKN